MLCHQDKPLKLPSFCTLATVILISTTVFFCLFPSSEANILQSMTRCIKRGYRYYANKTQELNGRLLRCEGHVTVKSCWGRCDSYELGDYQIPYKISHHPVCTYGATRSRKVKIPRCHPDHPDPTLVIFDAVSCVCKECDSETTSCENLKG